MNTLRIHQGKKLLTFASDPLLSYNGKSPILQLTTALEKGKSYRVSINSKTLFSIRPQKNVEICTNSEGLMTVKPFPVDIK